MRAVVANFCDIIGAGMSIPANDVGSKRFISGAKKIAEDELDLRIYGVACKMTAGSKLKDALYSNR